MAKARKLADARSIFALRRLQAAGTLMRLQEADAETRSAEEAEACARRQVRVAAEQWQGYLSGGAFRPDFASALAGAIHEAEAETDEAARARLASEARSQMARQEHSKARSAEEGAEKLLRRVGRQVCQQRDAREQMQMEDAAGLKERRTS